MTKSKKSWDELNKLFGDKMFRGDQPIVLTDPVIPFPSPSLADASHWGGAPFGKMTQFHGPEGCLDKNTFVQYNVLSKDGAMMNSEGGTIEELYESFHMLKGKGSGCFERSPSDSFSALSANEDGGIFQNKIVDVVKTGEKKCLSISVGEHNIISTEEHKFWTGTCFVSAGELKVGDYVHIHNKTAYTKERAVEKHRRYIFVKSHPNAGEKIVKAGGEEYKFSRVLKSKAVVEAALNHLTFTEYVDVLNSGNTSSLKFLKRGFHIHHLDENILNNDLGNLAIVAKPVRNLADESGNHDNLRYISIPQQITSIDDVGTRATYDIKMESPYNNYVANDFVVHNSGKTFFAMLMVRELLESDPEAEVFWFDCEQSFNMDWAESMGVDLSRMHFSEENVGAEVFSMICGRPGKMKQGKQGKGKPGILDMNKTGDLNVRLIVLDSIPALIPPGEMGRGMEEIEMAAMARFLPKALRVTTKKLADTNTAMICINHAKESMEMHKVNKYTYPGGRGLKYMLSLVVLFDTTQSKAATLYDEDGNKCGHRVDCTIEKTRGGPNKWKAQVWLDFVNGNISKLGEEAALLGHAYGIVSRPNLVKWVYKEHEVTGADNFYAYLDENEDVLMEILTDCKELKARGTKRSEELVQVLSDEDEDGE